ncbi:MAG TPA: aminoacetone oxidase family FAD-binding enzyme, partial [Comamonadaceae bacterium]|nr:aminoacetone oxidase family FAD-binding enzyme [Comamonadaceae bacterium]
MPSSYSSFDAVIVGAGAAGLFCAAQAGQRGLKVLLIDHAPRVAEKIRISGGGRCNFTNRDLDLHAPQRHFVGGNPQFARSALSRYTPADFIA